MIFVYMKTYVVTPLAESSQGDGSAKGATLYDFNDK